MPKTYWLKMIGAADNELDDRWIETDPHLLKEVRFPKQPSGIGRGDHLVYYSAGSQKIFAIARAKSSGADAPIVGAKGEGRWPYLLDVQTLLVIPQLALARIGPRSTSQLERQTAITHRNLGGGVFIGSPGDCRNRSAEILMTPDHQQMPSP